jgi:glutathione synthase
MSPEPQWLFITDPWPTLDHPRDTTLRLIAEALQLGVTCAWTDTKSVRWQHDAALVDAFHVRSIGPDRAAAAIDLVPLGPRRPSDFQQVHYRTDPPVDLAYLQPLQLIDLDLERAATDGRRSELVNPAAVLTTRCEKLLACNPTLAPPTVAAGVWDVLAAFGEAEGRVVAKPLHQCQSKDVALLDFETTVGRERARAVLGRLTEGFTRPAMLQRYLPGVLEGETRLWLADGRLVACVRKRAAAGTYKIDMDKGGTLARHELTLAEERQVPAITRVLARHGVRLAAVDLIDGLVTDCNFTSPGLLPLMEEVLGENLAGPVIETLLRAAPVAALSVVHGASAGRVAAGS